MRSGALAAAAVTAVVLLVVVLTTGGNEAPPQPADSRQTVGQPADPLIGTPDRDARSPGVAPAQADRVARRFLRAYLALLYGRGDLDDVRDVTPAVRRALRSSLPRVPAAQRLRRPRVVDLRLTRQADAAVLVTVSIDDGGVAIYPLVFTLDRRADTWVVSRLADD